MTVSSSQHAAARAEPFGFRCSACSHCCPRKIIQINPYEIAQLADFLGMSTQEFRERWTEDGMGTVLARSEEDVCVFLGGGGCTVHPARPLVCRLYPLGRRRSGDGTEHWHRLDPHPLSGGTFDGGGTIADYLEEQQAQPFIDAADAYAEWVNAAREIMARVPHENGSDTTALDVLDLDEAVTAHCAHHGLAEPVDPAIRLDMHVAFLYEQLDRLRREGEVDGKDRL